MNHGSHRTCVTLLQGMVLALLAAACRTPPESPPTYPEPPLVPIAASDPPVIAMSTPVDAATATVFDVSSGDLHVTYTAAGPDGQPQLTYVSGTQNLTFAGPQIRTVTQTDLGTLVSVTIWRTVDAGSTSFTLLVPPVVVVTPGTPVNVTLLGIATTHPNVAHVRMGATVPVSSPPTALRYASRCYSASAAGETAGGAGRALTIGRMATRCCWNSTTARASCMTVGNSGGLPSAYAPSISLASVAALHHVVRAGQRRPAKSSRSSTTREQDRQEDRRHVDECLSHVCHSPAHQAGSLDERPVSFCKRSVSFCTRRVCFGTRRECLGTRRLSRERRRGSSGTRALSFDTRRSSSRTSSSSCVPRRGSS